MAKGAAEERKCAAGHLELGAFMSLNVGGPQPELTSYWPEPLAQQEWTHDRDFDETSVVLVPHRESPKDHRRGCSGGCSHQ